MRTYHIRAYINAFILPVLLFIRFFFSCRFIYASASLSFIRSLSPNHLLAYFPHFENMKVGLTSPKSGGRSVGIVGSRTEATGFSFMRSP
jgi:hypothetical protein